MKTTENQINEIPVAINVDFETGEIMDSFFEGDSYTKHSKESKENKKKFLDEEKKCPVFNKGVSFVKLYDDVLDELNRVLTTAEFTFCIRLSKHVSYKDCILRTNGNPNGKILDANDISELFDMPQPSVRRNISALVKQGILGKHTTGCKENLDIQFKCITCNPYIFTRGNKINATTLSLFENSKWE